MTTQDKNPFVDQNASIEAADKILAGDIYRQSRYNKFAKDMKTAGFKPYHYRGRFYYEGPAVNCDQEEFQTVLGATKIPVQWDDMGLGKVVYPKWLIIFKYYCYISLLAIVVSIFMLPIASLVAMMNRR